MPSICMRGHHRNHAGHINFAPKRPTVIQPPLKCPTHRNVSDVRRQITVNHSPLYIHMCVAHCDCIFLDLYILYYMYPIITTDLETVYSDRTTMHKTQTTATVCLQQVPYIRDYLGRKSYNTRVSFPNCSTSNRAI